MKKHIFLTELKRSINWKTLAAIIGIAFCICFDSWNELQSSIKYGSGTVHYFFYNSGFGGVCRCYFLPIFTTLPFASSFCREYQENMLPFIVSREGKTKYCIVKYTANAVMGGLAAALGTALLLAALSAVFPIADAADSLYQNPGMEDYFHTWLVSHHPVLYCAVETANGFLTGFLWSSVALWTSAFIPNSFVTTTSPYLANFALVHTCRLLGIENRFRLDKWLTGYSLIGSSAQTLLLSAAVILCIFALLGISFTKKVHRRIEHELHQ